MAVDSPTRVVTQGGAATLRVRRVELRVLEGPDQGTVIVCDSDRIVVGTAAGSGLCLRDPAVSRHHLEIVIGAEGYLLRDLGSTNGTWVEGMRARELFLKDGVTLAVGQTRLRFGALAEESEVELSGEERFFGLVGASAAMRRLFATLAKVVARDITVLCTGESGTGKELVARAIHEGSARRGGPFVVVDGGAMPTGLMESEIFGHEKGAFTGADRSRAGAFERADGGTLFLDEIGELPSELQPKLLRVLEQREVARLGGGAPRKVDVRVVAATNRDLRAEVNRGAFRQDLFYRLSVMELRLPALRERAEDVPLLVRHFLDDIGKREGNRTQYQISPRTLEKLARHTWPGNVRELRNFVDRAVTLSDGGTLAGTLSGMGIESPPASPPPAPAGPPASTPLAGAGSGTLPAEALRVLPFKTAKRLYTEPFERDYLAALLARTSGNVSKAAREADLDRAYLIQILKKYDLK